MIGFLLATAVAGAVPAQSGPTLAQWAGQDADTRRISLVGAVEGVLLASSALNGPTVPVNTECFNSQTPQFLDDALVAMSRKSPSMPLAEGLISIEQCTRKAAAR